MAAGIKIPLFGQASIMVKQCLGSYTKGRCLVSNEVEAGGRLKATIRETEMRGMENMTMKIPASILTAVAVMLTTGSALAAAEEAGLPPALKDFVTAKARQVRRTAERLSLEVSPEVDDYLKAAQSGDWRLALGMYGVVRSSWLNLDDPDQRSLEAVASACLLEIQLGFEQIMEDDTDQELALKLGNAMVASVSRGAIYFGGTDAGRGLVTALSKSHENGDPFFTVTQNALADGRYLRYLREMYGRTNYMPSEADSTKAFQEYLSDAQRRLDHDQKFPSESRQIKPGEDVRISKGKVQVSGQVAVMSINAILARIIFEQNPDREFFVEESFPLDWMYPHLAPQGMLLRLHRKPVVEITAADVAKDMEYWSRQQQPLIGDWLKPETSIEEICQYVRKRHVNHNMAGFEGNAKFLQSEKVRKTWAKLRSAIGGIYAWRAGQASDPKVKERMTRAAENAFKQAFAFGPDSAEPVLRYVNLLVGAKRKADAVKIAELAADLESGDGSIANLLTTLQKMKLD